MKTDAREGRLGVMGRERRGEREGEVKVTDEAGGERREGGRGKDYRYGR